LPGGVFDDLKPPPRPEQSEEATPDWMRSAGAGRSMTGSGNATRARSSGSGRCLLPGPSRSSANGRATETARAESRWRPLRSALRRRWPLRSGLRPGNNENVVEVRHSRTAPNLAPLVQHAIAPHWRTDRSAARRDRRTMGTVRSPQRSLSTGPIVTRLEARVAQTGSAGTALHPAETSDASLAVQTGVWSREAETPVGRKQAPRVRRLSLPLVAQGGGHGSPADRCCFGPKRARVAR
jgi:hypothetical protein